MNELVLIVEDEDTIAQLLRYNLQKAGYRTVIAADGAQALRSARMGEPDLVLLDLMLPELDGWEVCRILRSSEQAATVPIIMLTALTGDEAKIRGLQYGADDFITKPFSVQALLLKIRRTLDQRTALRALERRTSSAESSLRILVHEVKNSLSVISGYSSLAAEQNDDPCLRRIATTADTLDHLLNDATLLTKLESGTHELHLEPLSFSDAVQGLLDAFQGTAAERRVQLSLMNATEARVVGSRAGLWHVLSNILTNAVKFSPPNGRVWLRFDETHDRIELSVKDEGPGIPRELLDRIFDKYYRCPGSETVTGSGIGLYVAKLLTESMYGTIMVVSDPGSGSTFTVSLPREREAAALPRSA